MNGKTREGEKVGMQSEEYFYYKTNWITHIGVI
jgi:hypothetical protein